MKFQHKLQAAMATIALLAGVFSSAASAYGPRDYTNHVRMPDRSSCGVEHERMRTNVPRQNVTREFCDSYVANHSSTGLDRSGPRARVKAVRASSRVTRVSDRR